MFFRRHLKSLIVLAVTLVLGAAALGFWRSSRGMEACFTHVVQRIPGPGTYDAEVSETECAGIAGSDTMSVDLVPNGARKPVTIFRYERMNPDPKLSRQDVPPTVTWLAANRLAISIDMISSVDKQIGEKDGVKIDYRIGAIEYR